MKNNNTKVCGGKEFVKKATPNISNKKLTTKKAGKK